LYIAIFELQVLKANSVIFIAILDYLISLIYSAYFRCFRGYWLSFTTWVTDPTTSRCPSIDLTMENGMRWSLIVMAKNSPFNWTVAVEGGRLRALLGGVRR
jgi:hypothetical protein